MESVEGKFYMICDNVIGIVTGYALDARGSIPGRGERFFFSSWRPHQLWDPPSLPSSGCRGFFYRE
jgi:hypothetical protein